jgi:hypothetical protein
VLASVEGRGRGLGMLGARFEGLLVGEGWPGAGTPAAREGRPPRLPTPARLRPGAAVGRLGSVGRS